MFKFLVVLFLADYCSATFFGGGGGGGCGCGGGCGAAPACPPPQACPPPSCAPPIPTGGGGYYSGGYSSSQPVAAGGYYATAPGGAPVSVPLPGSATSSSYQSGAVGGTYIGTGGISAPGTYLTSAAAQAPLKTTVVKTRYSSSNEKDKDFYDEPPPDFKVADVSAESKELPAADIFKRRYLMLKNLRYRHLRQLSAPSLPIPSSNVCNNEKLARIMAKSIVTDISISKRLIRKATEISFNGLKFDVICAQGDFSYSIYAEQYCETTRGNVTCFAFT